METDLSVEKGSAFYLLRRKDSIPSEEGIPSPLFLEESTMEDYEDDAIGPIPLCELTRRLPKSLVQIPPLVWNNPIWTKTRRGAKHPREGDFIICLKGVGRLKSPYITGGFFVMENDLSVYRDMYKFVTWSSIRGNEYGFIYCSQIHIHPSISNYILTKINSEIT